MDSRARNELAQRYRTTTIIGVAMIAAVLGYVVVGEVIKRALAPFEGFSRFPGWETMRYVFWGIAVVDAFLIRILRNQVLTRPVTGAKLQQASVVTYAMCESVVLFGFVLFVISGNSFDLYAFAVAALALFAIYFPRYEQWEELVRGG